MNNHYFDDRQKYTLFRSNRLLMVKPDSMRKPPDSLGLGSVGTNFRSPLEDELAALSAEMAQVIRDGQEILRPQVVRGIDKPVSITTTASNDLSRQTSSRVADGEHEVSSGDSFFDENYVATELSLDSDGQISDKVNFVLSKSETRLLPEDVSMSQINNKKNIEYAERLKQLFNFHILHTEDLSSIIDREWVEWDTKHIDIVDASTANLYFITKMVAYPQKWYEMIANAVALDYSRKGPHIIAYKDWIIQSGNNKKIAKRIIGSSRIEKISKALEEESFLLYKCDSFLPFFKNKNTSLGASYPSNDLMEFSNLSFDVLSEIFNENDLLARLEKLLLAIDATEWTQLAADKFERILPLMERTSELQNEIGNRYSMAIMEDNIVFDLLMQVNDSSDKPFVHIISEGNIQNVNTGKFNKTFMILIDLQEGVDVIKKFDKPLTMEQIFESFNNRLKNKTSNRK